MATSRDLQAQLERLDGKGYPAYKAIRGSWELGDFRLSIDHVQGDPFAAPSRVSAHLPPASAGLDSWLLESRPRRLGAAAWLAHEFSLGVSGVRGSGCGKSGAVAMASPGQLVLPQTAVQVGADGTVEARFTVGLPARGRRILGRAASALLTATVPELVRRFLCGSAHPPDILRRAAAVNEDAEALRDQLDAAALVAFVADGAILPRLSGVDDRPLPEGAVPFESPEPLRVTLTAPNAGAVTGMGIPRGVTLVVGGGFHGKSTLLHAIEAGVYNHRPGDGREAVVTVSDAVKIRAEDGRSVTGVDISPFIDGLPGGQETRRFSTRNASGSTSQAAGLVEALSLGASALLMDEDTCATNFLIRDRRMQALVPAPLEPITPLVDRVRELHREHGVSAVLVLGGSGDYLDVADRVISMNAFQPVDVTEEARRVASRHPTGRSAETGRPLGAGQPRPIGVRSLPQGRADRDLRVRVLDERTLRVGGERLDLSALEQLLLPSQLRTVAAALEALARDRTWGGTPLSELVARIARAMAADLDTVDRRSPGDLAWVRPFELGAALNRLRTLEVDG
jgi:predicted ABC-class ATPase